ncbi:MAG: glycosyltransferase family 2 protein [Spirochaetes bacterium]|nr:glycosyltransferase family 2 protein [Spirochaetota bacterium]
MKNKPLVSIIVPTYHEAENIPELTQQINGVLTGEKINYEIIIVDDDSRDGIDRVVKGLSRAYPVDLHVRINEKGLSSAVILGFSLARGNICVVMDADLSHPPGKISELIKPIMEGKSEFVIGSRFVPGGSIPHFNWFRKLNAWVSRMLARPLAAVRDPMSGFFAFPKHLLASAGDRLNPLGFKIGLELLVKTDPRNIMEIPIQFQKRLHGESKLSLKEQLLYIAHLFRLYTYRYEVIVQFVQFSLIGASGIPVNLFTVYLAYKVLSLPYSTSLVLGFIFAVTSNYILNKFITFSRTKPSNSIMQYLEFIAICLAGLSINLIISLSLYNHVGFFRRYYIFTALIGILAGTIINYTGSKLLVFRK